MKKLILLTALLWAAYANISFAAIDFDNSSSGSCWNNCNNNVNWSHSVTGSNRGILAFLQGYDANDVCDYHVMYNNVEMTLVAVTAKYDSSQFKTYAFKQENPSTSATGVSAVAHGNCGFSVAVVSYTGVNQSNMVDSYNTGTNPASSVASVTTTTGVANARVVSGHGQDNLISWTPGNGQTEQVDVNDGVYGRSIEVTDKRASGSGTILQMTGTPSNLNKETGSVVVSLTPSARVQMTGSPSNLNKETGSVAVSLAPAA